MKFALDAFELFTTVRSSVDPKPHRAEPKNYCQDHKIHRSPEYLSC